MKKMRRFAFMFVCALAFICAMKTTEVQAAGNDKTSAEQITHDTLYELTGEKDTSYWYTFNAVDYTNYYKVTVNNEVNGYYSNFKIYDEDNTVICDLSVRESWEVNCKLTPGAKYYVKVTCAGTAHLVSFKLSPEVDVADTMEEAKLIEANTLYEESNCVSDDADWYRFVTGLYYQNYSFIVNEESDNYFYVYIYDEENTKLAGGLVNSHTEINLNLLPNKTYYIKTLGYGGTYSLKFTPGEYYNGWYMATNAANVEKAYWYEGGIRQGTYDDAKGVLGDGTVRGREIYDPDSDGWYWLDSCYDGAKAEGKEVWIPYIYQNEAEWSEEEINSNAAASGDMAAQVAESIRNHTGKWVRYNEEGKMYKGWYRNWNNANSRYDKYYYDPKTGLMAKGSVMIEGTEYYFDPITGILQ